LKLQDINLLDREVYTRGIPHEWFAFLRANAPVYRHPESAQSGGPGFWVISKYDDVVQVSRDVATFSSRCSSLALEEVEQPGRRPPEVAQNANIIMHMDPPEHSKYRRIVSRAFVPRMINALEGHIRDLCGQVLDAAIAKGTCDFVPDISSELPIRVICELLGVPSEDRHYILDLSNRIAGSEDPEFLVGEDQMAEAQGEMFAYAQKMAEQRLKSPGGDVVSMMLAGEVDGENLSPLDFNVFFLLLAVAGNETTRTTATAGLHALIDNPDQYAALVADPGLIPQAVEEMLRWASPVQWFPRVATRDTGIRGINIARGDRVVHFLVSANFDEEVFADPFRFDIRRNPNPQISFGGGGPHYCIGAPLARLQLRILFEELVKRVPRIKAAGQAEYLRSIQMCGIKHLPIDLSAAQRASVPVV